MRDWDIRLNCATRLFNVSIRFGWKKRESFVYSVPKEQAMALARKESEARGLALVFQEEFTGPFKVE